MKALHVKQIEQDILKYGYLDFYAIIVTSKYEIIEGQHRFMACKNLNLPIVFQIFEGNNEEVLSLIRMINSASKVWAQQDFIQSYADEGRNDYVSLNEFGKKHNLTSSNAILIYSGTGKKNIRSGENLTRLQNSEEIAILFNRFDKLSFAKTKSLAYALKVLINENISNHNLEFLVANQYRLVQSSTCDLYLEQFEILLNKRKGRNQKVNFTRIKK